MIIIEEEIEEITIEKKEKEIEEKEKEKEEMEKKEKEKEKERINEEIEIKKIEKENEEKEFDEKENKRNIEENEKIEIEIERGQEKEEGNKEKIKIKERERERERERKDDKNEVSEIQEEIIENEIERNKDYDFEENKTEENEGIDIESDPNSSIQSDTSKNTEIIDIETNINEEPYINIDIENAKKRANISNSFRQLNIFRNEAKSIIFSLFGLVTKTYLAKTKIKISVNLIKITGEMEEFTREINYILESTIEILKGNSSQAEFKCSLTDLNEDYYSLRFNYSDFISGIPTDEILLNPELTEESIESGEIYDYSLSENKKENKIPPTFTSQTIKKNLIDDKLIIEGTLNKDVNNKLKFDLPLTYPIGVSMLCSLTSFEAGPSSIICRVDRDIDSEPVIIEQTIVTYKKYEILVITGIISDKNMTFENGLFKEAKEKINNTITFRQVTQLEGNGNDGFSFRLKVIFSKEFKKVDKFILNIIVLIGDYAIGKDSICAIKNNATINNYILGNYECITTVSQEEYEKINFNKAESITISPYNTNITGTFGIDKNMLSPSPKSENSTTDNYIELDFPTFKPEKLEKTENCWNKG